MSRVHVEWKWKAPHIEDEDIVYPKLKKFLDFRTNVIIPDPTLHDDEVDLSYHTFLELYKFRIIYYLMQIDDISLTKAYSEWSRAYKFNNRIYEIMQFIVKKEKPKILMNRNPTLVMIWCRKTYLIAGKTS